MRIKVVVAAVAGALATWLVVAAVGGAAGTAGASPVTTFHLTEVDESFHFIDNPPLGGSNQPPSQGDAFVSRASCSTGAGNRRGISTFTATR
jgi:hypothetical protein